MTDTRREPTFSYSGLDHQPRVRARRRSAAPVLFVLLALALGVAGWYWWSQSPSWRGLPAIGSAPADAPAQPAPQAALPKAPPELIPADAGDIVKAEDVTAALTQFLGRETVLKFLETTDFPRKAVATLDNLGREHAPISAWPVLPSPGRFIATGNGASTVIATENAMRYWPFVGFVDSLDAAQAVGLYRRMYPVLQHEYRELGFVQGPLHARVLEVVDLLLATPEPAQPPRITLTEVKGPVASTRPWTRYEYVDPALQRLTSGQRILLRVGPDNRRVLKAKLEEIRRELLRASAEPSKP